MTFEVKLNIIKIGAFIMSAFTVVSSKLVSKLAWENLAQIMK